MHHPLCLWLRIHGPCKALWGHTVLGVLLVTPRPHDHWLCFNFKTFFIFNITHYPSNRSFPPRPHLPKRTWEMKVKPGSFSGCFTVNLKSVVGFEVTRRHLAQDREHVQEVVQRHVPLSVLRENLGDPLAERIVLHSGTYAKTEVCLYSSALPTVRLWCGFRCKCWIFIWIE